MRTTARITLYRDPAARCWMADCSRAHDAAETRRALGTDQVPTAFTLAADAERVRTAIARLNPQDVVVIREAVTR
jgi:hypothetical protein